MPQKLTFVLIQPSCFIMLIHVIVMQTSIFSSDFHKKKKEVCITTRSISASRSIRGHGTKLITVKWSI